ncbi:hypothetical protein [Microbispora sp. H10836]|uniref:hypothetical protein n=1 Tax=Microbispora sp. H10836 TaxID=2729106 RepID=UPI001B8D3E4C|nr:hypothetical protein [Microbispora sp. H10836]
MPGIDVQEVEQAKLQNGRLGDDRRVLAVSGNDLHAGQSVEDELAGGDGRSSGVQALDCGPVLFGQCLPDLAFDQTEDEQGQADDGDQGGDAPVVLQVEGRDGQRAFEGGVAAFDRFLSFVEGQDGGGVGLLGGQVGEQGVPAVDGGFGVDRLGVEAPGQGGFAGAGSMPVTVRR